MKQPGIDFYFLRWLNGFAGIIDGLCVVFTAGFYNPWLSFRFVVYSSERELKKRIKEGEVIHE